MLTILSAMLVMLESGSVPAPRLDLSVPERIASAGLGPALLRPQPAEGPLRLGRELSDCNPGIVGIDPGYERLAASQDLLICRATMLKDEPVGRAFLWVGSQTGLQAAFSASGIQLNVRFAP